MDSKAFVPPGSNYQPMKTYGGEAPKYYADLRIKLRRKFDPKDKEKKLEEQIVIATVVKNKLAPPLKEATFNIVYGKGVDTIDELATIAVDKEIVKRTGAWYNYKDLKFQGLDALVNALREQPELLKELEV